MYAFGEAHFMGDLKQAQPRPTILAMAPTPSGNGYYMLSADGGLYCFGDAAFKGTMSGQRLAQPIVTIEAAPTGSGYWLIGGDGAVYPFGDERFDGADVTTAPAVARWVEAVHRAADDAEAGLPGLFVERKGEVAVGLHWRSRPDLEAAAVDLGRRLAGLHGLRLEPGRQTLELRPPLDVDKGTAVEELVATASAALFMGDDRGDLAAFETLTRLVDEGPLVHAVRVAVRSAETPADLLERADVVVDGPRGALCLLDELVALV